MMIRKNFFLLLLLLLTCVNVTAFESENSAINFAWDYAKKNIESIDGYNVGILMSEIDTIINMETIILPPKEPFVVYDTILVPPGYYVIGIESREMFSGGCNPYTLLYASKEDSTYITIDACGDFMNIYNCQKPFENMFTRQTAIDTLIANLSDFVGDSNCIMYMKKEETDSLFAPLWNFLIESKSDTFLISYIKDIYFDDKPHYIIEQNKQYDINDYEKVYFRQNGGIDNLGSREKNVVYPNPTSEIVRIDLDNCSACLCTMDGCELKCVDSNQLLISEFPSGLYLLKVMRNDLIHYEKLIVRK